MHGVPREDSAAVQALGELAWRYLRRSENLTLDPAAQLRMSRRASDSDHVYMWHMYGSGPRQFSEILMAYRQAAGDG